MLYIIIKISQNEKYIRVKNELTKESGNIPEMTEDHVAKLDEEGRLTDNYYICVVTDGIDTKEVKIGITSEGNVIEEVSTRYFRPDIVACQLY